MASTGFTNLYHRRLVAEEDAKACWLCFKPVCCVLITVDNADYFYICPGHLTDNKFATAKDAEDLAKKQKDEEIEKEIEKEIEQIKREFAAKMKKKLDRRRQREYEKEGKRPEEAKKKDEEEEKQLEKEQEEKVKELEKKRAPEKAEIEGPRIFELHKDFYKMRQQRKAQAAAAKRNQERMRTPNLFPSVPKDVP